MSVIGGIALYALGVVTGGGLVIANRLNLRKETTQLRRENEHLKMSAWKDRLLYETDRAYWDGYKDGRLSPANDAEKFAAFVEDRNIDFRGQRRRRQREDAED